MVDFDITSAWSKYLELGSIHRAAEHYGLCGESLRRILIGAGYRLNGSKWTESEYETVRRYYLETRPEVFDLRILAKSLNRTPASVALKGSRLGLSDKKILSQMVIARRSTPPRVPGQRRSDVGAKRPRHFNTCKQCGKNFHAPHAFKRKYCSLKCAYSDKSRLPASPYFQPRDRGTRECLNCGVVFKVHTSAKDATHCSQKCAASRTGKITLQKNRVIVPRTSYISRECAYCGKTFQSWRSSNRVYCSMACSRVEAPIKSAMANHANGTYTSNRCYSRGASGWRVVGDRRIFFRSSWEANYARYLQHLKSIREIKQWEHEPKVFHFKGIKRGCCSYLPDFRVTFMDGRVEFHEVKGWMDKKSVIKLTRMAKYFPKVHVEVFGLPWFKANTPALSKLLPDWEKRARLSSKS